MAESLAEFGADLLIRVFVAIPCPLVGCDSVDAHKILHHLEMARRTIVNHRNFFYHLKLLQDFGQQFLYRV